MKPYTKRERPRSLLRTPASRAARCGGTLRVVDQHLAVRGVVARPRSSRGPVSERQALEVEAPELARARRGPAPAGRQKRFSKCVKAGSVFLPKWRTVSRSPAPRRHEVGEAAARRDPSTARVEPPLLGAAGGADRRDALGVREAVEEARRSPRACTGSREQRTRNSAAGSDVGGHRGHLRGREGTVAAARDSSGSGSGPSARWPKPAPAAARASVSLARGRAPAPRRASARRRRLGARRAALPPGRRGDALAGSTAPEGLVLLHLNGEPYDQKPPLYFWLAALAGRARRAA